MSDQSCVKNKLLTIDLPMYVKEPTWNFKKTNHKKLKKIKKKETNLELKMGPNKNNETNFCYT